MGAAGFVTFYRRSEVEAKYAELYPDKALTDDWWYLDTITVALDGERWICDYADDQGNHEGTGSDFWFSAKERVAKDDLPENAPTWDLNEGWGNTAGTYSAAQVRVVMVLRNLTESPRVEVWT